MSTETQERLVQGPFGEWVLPDYSFEPEYLGPAWQRDESGEFILPEFTLGWQAIDWAEAELLSDEVDERGQPKPWRFTAEQSRVVLWWYAVNRNGEFVYRDGIIQRLKGWGPPR